MGLLIVVLVFLTTFILMLGFFKLIGDKEEPMARLEAYMNTGSEVLYEQEGKKAKVHFLRSIGRYLGEIKVLKNLTKSTSTILIQADLPLSGEELAVIQLFVALPLSYLILLISGDILFGILGFLLLWLMPLFYIRYKKAARIKKFNEQLGDALSIFSNSLKAGYSYLQAVNSVAKEMPDPISKEFARVLKEMRFGLDQRQSLMNLLDRVDSEDLKLMVTAIIIQKETGGNLSEILDNIASTIRDRVRLQGEVKTLTAQGRFSGLIVALVPFVLGLFMYMVNKPYIMLLFREPAGRLMLGVALVNEVIGVLLIRKIIKIEV
jgi:tight adherence protein B